MKERAGGYKEGTISVGRIGLLLDEPEGKGGRCLVECRGTRGERSNFYEEMTVRETVRTSRGEKKTPLSTKDRTGWRRAEKMPRIPCGRSGAIGSLGQISNWKKQKREAEERERRSDSVSTGVVT